MTTSELEKKLRSQLQITDSKTPAIQRQILRESFRNFCNLNQIQDIHGKNLISAYDQSYKVLRTEDWWRDNWEATDFGIIPNFSEDLFSQFKNLGMQVPRIALLQTNVENCEYTNASLDSKDCYLCFGLIKSEKSYYGHIVWESSFCLDCTYTYKCNWCADCVDIASCYEVFYSQDCTNCSQSYFLYNCINCRECFGCSGLKNATHCLFNKQLTKEKYHLELNKLLPLNREKIKRISEVCERLIKDSYIPASFSLNIENVTGNHNYNSQNLTNSFDAKDCVDCENLFTVTSAQNCCDISFSGANNRFCLDNLTITNCELTTHSHYLYFCHNSSYSEFCYNSNNLLFCIGLRNKSFCIFNKQYSEDEYKKLKFKIYKLLADREQLGDFFPPFLSPFGYNKSIANDYNYLSKEDAINQNFNWDLESDYVTNADLSFAPDNSIDLSQTYQCIKSHRPFKFQNFEKDFRERFNLAIPELCWQERHINRLAKRSKRKLSQRKCNICHVEIKTSNHGKVICNECYTKNI